MKKSRLGALVAAAALTLTFAGTAFADGQTNWTGNGLGENGYNDGCKEDGPDTMLWIYNPGGNGNVTAAELFINGQSQGAMSDKTGNFKLITSYIAPGDLDSAYVLFTGTEGNNSVVTISHACEGVTTTTTTTTTTQPTTTTTTESINTETTDTTTTTTTTDSINTETTSHETTSEETTPEGSVEELTPPHTDTIGQPASSSSVSTGMLLVLAGILSIVLVAVPAAVRNRR